MFRNISVGLKIGGGFILVLLLLAFVAAIGYKTIQKSSQGFSDYRAMAMEANAVAEFQSSFLRLRNLAKDIALTGGENATKTFDESYGETLRHLETALKLATDDLQRENLESTLSQLQGFHDVFLDVTEVQAQINELRNGPLKEGGSQLESKLGIISQSDFDDDPPSVTYLSAQAFRTALETRLAAQDFLFTQSERALKFVKSKFIALDSQMEMLGNDIVNVVRTNWFEEAMEGKEMYFQAVNRLAELFDQRDALNETLKAKGQQAAANVNKAQADVVEMQDELGPRLQAENKQAGATMLTASAVAVAVGIMLAVLIGLGLTRPLRRAMEFSRRIAAGDFAAQLDIKGRDEVAQLAQAMEQIPATLRRVVSEFNNTVAAMQQGRYTTRSDPSAFEGAYREIIEGANQISDRLMSVIDNSPLAIMAVDTQFNVLYMNKAGAEAGGVQQAGKLLGSKCFEHFKTNKCQTEDCVCQQSMTTRDKQQEEITAQPLGKVLHLATYAMPIIDQQGKLAGSLEFIVDQTKIKGIQQTMRQVADEATAIADDLSSAAEELAAQSAQISESAGLQQNRMAETATSMEEMNATVLEVARNAGEAAANSEEARDKAQDGEEVVRQAVAAINAVSSSAEQLQASMTVLGEQAQSIGKVMNVITDIADQTNLLALNAAIEAARAGDAGRGFAVVADEVRKLAEKTMGATKEVETSIHSIQQAARDNLRSMEAAGKAVAEATELSDKAGRSLTEIVQLVENNAHQISNIATAAEEQSASSNEISSTVEEMNRHVSETTQAMNESARAVQELSNMAARLNGLINQLR